MDHEPKLRGAAPINDELEVGYDDQFEGRWTRAERVGRVVMAAIVVVALAGLLGRGPFSHRTVATTDGTMAVDYEPVARYATSTQISVHLSPDASDGPERQARLFISGNLAEPMGLQRIQPEPVSSTLRSNGVDYVFNLPPGEGDSVVRFQTTPVSVGPVQLTARRGSDTLTWTQVVLP